MSDSLFAELAALDRERLLSKLAELEQHRRIVVALIRATRRPEKPAREAPRGQHSAARNPNKELRSAEGRDA